MRWIVPPIISAVIFGILDFLWLGRVGRPLYDDRIGHLLAAEFNMAAAIAFYILYVLGITYFVTIPALQAGSLGRAVFGGAFLGLLAYGSWNLVNLSVVDGFPASILPIDMTWGTVATGTTAALTYFICRRLPVTDPSS